jgi:hypothetical protein
VPIGSSVPFKRKDHNQGLGSKGPVRMDPSKERGFAVKFFNSMGLKQNTEHPMLIRKPIWNFVYQLVIIRIQSLIGKPS